MSKRRSVKKTNTNVMFSTFLGSFLGSGNPGDGGAFCVVENNHLFNIGEPILNDKRTQTGLYYT